MPIYTYKCKVCKNPVENYSKEFCTSDDDAFVGSSCNDQHCDGGSSISMEDGFKRMKKSQGVIQ